MRLLHSLLIATTILLSLLPSAARAQSPGDLDPSFESGSQVDGLIRAVAPAGDDKVYIGGEFTSVRGAMRTRIARLNADGTVDLSFDPGTGPNLPIRSVAVQADGKVLIAGDFTTYNGTARSGIARLHADGSLDTGFSTKTISGVGSVLVLADGKVLILGSSSSDDGTASSNGVARLHADGSLDQTFHGDGSGISAMAAQADGKVLIGGGFTSYGGTPRNRIARLNSDGSLDASFDPGAGANNLVYAVAAYTDGKVLIGGNFTNYDGTGPNRIARLNADGSLDETFQSGTGTPDEVYSVALQTDGKALIGGNFTTYNGTTRNHIARLNVDGSLDTDFSIGASGTVRSVVVQADGKVLIGGAFTRYHGVARSNVARIHSDGSPDQDFNPGTGANYFVDSVAVQADGKVLISGGFTNYNGTARNRFARLHTDASLDTSFGPGSGTDYREIHSVAMQNDGKILIGGSFRHYNGTARGGIARLHVDGRLDSTFDPGSGTNGSDAAVRSVAVQMDGKVLIAGSFTSYNGTARGRIARLHADGSLDTSFDPGSGASGSIDAVALQADGKVLIGGSFTSYNEAARNHIARLHADGSLDTSFNPRTGANNRVHTVTVQPDGKVLISGSFTSYHITARGRIARLHADGSLDTGFDPGSGVGGAINAMAVQADGKVLISGNFTSYGGTPRNRIARLNSDGSLDANFDPGAGADREIQAMALQADGKVLISGYFSSYNGTARSYLARVLNDPAIHTLTATSLNRVEWLRGGSSPEVGQVIFESSSDGLAWTFLGEATLISGGWELTNLSLPISGHLRARGRAAGGSSYGSSSHIIEQVSTYEFLVPELVLSANGVDIANGDSTPIAADHTYFGAVSLAGDPVTRTFTITNNGNNALNLIGDPMVELSGGTTFSVTRQPASATIAAGGGTETFEITFTSTTLGPHLATISIANNEANENPFIFRVQGNGQNEAASFADAMTAAGLTGLDAAEDATPFNDGVPNLLKYAFNMNLNGPDSSVMPADGDGGLPALTVHRNGANILLRFEFVRRKIAGPTYIPQKSATLDALMSWEALTAPLTVTTINTDWERVIFEETHPLDIAPIVFGRVAVGLP